MPNCNECHYRDDMNMMRTYIKGILAENMVHNGPKSITVLCVDALKTTRKCRHYDFCQKCSEREGKEEVKDNG